MLRADAEGTARDILFTKLIAGPILLRDAPQAFRDVPDVAGAKLAAGSCNITKCERSI